MRREGRKKLFFEFTQLKNIRGYTVKNIVIGYAGLLVFENTQRNAFSNTQKDVEDTQKYGFSSFHRG